MNLQKGPVALCPLVSQSLPFRKLYLNKLKEHLINYCYKYTKIKRIVKHFLRVVKAK
jgi:hypothetical protein